eukprot:553587-Pyramimonas_sp.AAC.1
MATGTRAPRRKRKRTAARRRRGRPRTRHRGPARCGFSSRSRETSGCCSGGARSKLERSRQG